LPAPEAIRTCIVKWVTFQVTIGIWHCITVSSDLNHRFDCESVIGSAMLFVERV